MNRVTFAVLPTPLERMDRLAEALGRPRGSILVKRDDRTGLASGGSKARKLSYLVADALARGCDHLITSGGVQSNHGRMTAAAAAKNGLGCTLVLEGERPERPSGNLLLDILFGATITWTRGHEASEVMEVEAERVRAAGGTPYVIPAGGGTPLGTVGMVDAAHELLGQNDAFDVVVVATGVGSIQAGLAAGFGSHERVVGVQVGTRPDIADAVASLACATATTAGLEAPSGAPIIDRDHAGPGYAMPTRACNDAIALTARTQGLFLDPIYTGKAMAALIDAVRNGRIAPQRQVVFWHSGGFPALLSAEQRTAIP